MTSGTEGGMRMPRVPAVASVPVARRPEYPWRFISGKATPVMVAAVATDDPQIAPKAAEARTAAIARPPLKRPMMPAVKANSARLMPPWVANCPIRMNSGMTDRS